MTDDPATTAIPDGVLDTIGFQITRLTKLRDRTNAQIAALTNGEVEPGAFAILFHLIHQGPVRSGVLAEGLFSDASTISRQVATLVKRGLIERRADPADGRVSVLAITDAGLAAAAEIRARRNQSLSTILGAWTPDERESFAELLHRFVDDYEVNRQEMLANLATHKELHPYFRAPEKNS
ncbi:MarR family winged helix-turn-helix transcriptional regulator [Nocardia jejuensis]|uniref:MarR family winged helix-turn-helix transcriptional regulator n=1 Tax=Nocardia jejuensis TaxID=328049 RepID=UPI000AD52B3D|nr:MarR family winged helix-turn-helix transcriptional regulator [Nocardia jejuensis]